MKKLFILALLSVSLNGIFSIPAPKKDREACAVVGRVYIYMAKNWESLAEGNYYNVTLTIENKLTKKKFTVSTNNSGYFYKLNIPPGIYTLKTFDVRLDRHEGTYFIWDIRMHSMVDNKDVEGLNFGVHDKSITVINTIVINAEVFPKGSLSVYFTRPDEKDVIIEYFKKEDKNGKWAGFDFGEYEEE